MALFEAFIIFLFYYFFHKKLFTYLIILQKALKSYPWNWPIFGMLPGVIVRLHSVYECSVEVLEKSNLTFQFKGPWFVGMDTLVTVDPANVHHIMSSNFSNYIKGFEFHEIFEAFGDGIINTDSDLWMNWRKASQPERWISETGGLRHEPSYKFLSFNAGPRTCLGKNLAMNLMKTVVVEILLNYEIKVIHGQKIEPKPDLILLMKHGLKVTITKKLSRLD